MAQTIRTFPGDDVTTLLPVSFDLGYIKQEHIYVYEGDDYTNQVSYTWVSSTQIQLAVATATGTDAKVRRVVPRNELTNDYEDGAIMKEANLDNSFMQALMITEEIEDGFVNGTETRVDSYAVAPIPEANKVIVWDPTGTFQINSEFALAEYEGNAEASAAAALVSENNAAASETAANTSETNAGTSETNAAASATQAANAVAGVPFNDVVRHIESIDGATLLITDAHRGVLIEIDATGGPVTLTLSLLSGLTTPFTCTVKKIDPSNNTVTVTANVSDDLNNVAGGSVQTSTTQAGLSVVADTDATPGGWTSATFGDTGTPLDESVTAPKISTSDAQAILDKLINNGGLLPVSNWIINGSFSVNQRQVTGSVVLATNVYGHDRWKGGASGCSYTFAKSLGKTTLTISAGSLIQPIEGNNLQAGNVTLAWEGSAQAQIDGGGYASSPITTSIAGGTNVLVEFGTGTVTNIRLVYGDAIPNWLTIDENDAETLTKCLRYTRREETTGQAGVCQSTTDVNLAFPCSGMRTTPTPTLIGSGNVTVVATTTKNSISPSLVTHTGSPTAIRIRIGGFTTLIAGEACVTIGSNTRFILLDGEIY